MNKTYKIDALPLRLVIGRQTETGVEMVQFDCTAWLSIWPDMEISVWPMRPGEIAAYPAIVERAGNIITWTITDVDTAVDGEGSVEVMGMADGKRKLSARAVTHILASGLGNTQERPEGARPWVDEVLDAAKRTEYAAAEAAEVSVHPPIIGDNGNWWLWDATSNAYVDSGKPSQGAGGGSSDVEIDTTLSVPGAAADAAVVGGKIEELSGEMAELNTAVESIAGVTEIVSVVFAESNIIHDAMINGYPGSATYGGVAQTNGYVCTTMIPLDFDAGKPVSVRCTLSGYAGLGIYDQGGNTLDVITGVNAADYGLVSGQGMKTYTIIMPEGAKYVRMSASTSTADGSPAYATPSDFVLMGEKTSGLSDKIAALENEINSNVTDIASKKVLVIGDSISADYYGDYPKWVTHLIDIGFFNSSNTANDSVHATGFVARYNNEANDFISRLATVTNPEVYDMVIVFGGINDYIKDIPMGESGGDKLTSFKPAVDDFFAMLTERFVGARIAVLSPLRTKNYNIANAAGHKQTDYADYIKTVAQTYALPVLDLMNHSGFHPEHDTFRQRWTFKNWTGGDGTQGDGTHPIEEYERKHLAPMIRHFLQGLI